MHTVDRKRERQRRRGSERERDQEDGHAKKGKHGKRLW